MTGGKERTDEDCLNDNVEEINEKKRSKCKEMETKKIMLVGLFKKDKGKKEEKTRKINECKSGKKQRLDG